MRLLPHIPEFPTQPEGFLRNASTRYNPSWMNRSPVLLVHGGAWDIPADALEAHEQGVFDALQEGWRILERGGSAVDAIEAAVTSMENDPIFDAGRGSFLTRDGRVQLD